MGNVTMRTELVYAVLDKRLDFAGYLVIDSMIEDRSSGGIRMTPTVTLNEVKNLARNMTLKYGFLGIPMGGAKAGVKINGALSRSMKRLILAEFGKILHRFIKNEHFIPGTDVGTSQEDIVWFFNAAEKKKKSHINLKPSGGPEYCSWTMASSARQAVRVKNADVAIEGFGKIGSSAARTFSKNGAKIVAISTCKGAIYNPKGLDVDLLLDLRKENGDYLVNKYCQTQKIARDRLFELPVDILLPCAGSYSIDTTIAHKIRAKVICPGANIPLTDGAEQALFKRGIVCLPDFVSNSGTVLGNYMVGYIGREMTKEIIDKRFGQTVLELLDISKERNTSPKKVAIEIAIRRFYEMKRAEGKLSRLFLRGIRSVLPDRCEKMTARFMAPFLFTRKLRRALA